LAVVFLHLADDFDDGRVGLDPFRCFLEVIRDPPDAVLLESLVEAAGNLLRLWCGERPDEVEELEGALSP